MSDQAILDATIVPRLQSASMDAGLEIGDAWNLLEEAAAQIDRIRAELSEFKRTEPLKRGELKDLRTEIRAAESYILEMEAWAVAQIENGSVFSDPPTRNFPLNPKVRGGAQPSDVAKQEEETNA